MKRLLKLVFGSTEENERLQRSTLAVDRRNIERQTESIQESVEILKARVAGLKATADFPGA